MKLNKCVMLCVCLDKRVFSPPRCSSKPITLVVNPIIGLDNNNQSREERPLQDQTHAGTHGHTKPIRHN